MMIPLADYARQHGRGPATARQMALRGGFQTAKKIGRDWLIDDQEPYPDRRVKTGQYKDWRKKMLLFDETSIKNAAAASEGAFDNGDNLYCVYYPRTGQLDYRFGPKNHPAADKPWMPNGFVVPLEVVKSPASVEDLKAMIEAACRKALEKHPNRKDLRGKL